MTLAVPPFPTFFPTIWGSCPATTFLLIDAQAYTTRWPNQVKACQLRAHLHSTSASATRASKPHISTFSWQSRQTEKEIDLFHLILSPSLHRIASISSPAARFPLFSFLGSSSSCWQPRKWHEHRFVITHDIPVRPQQLVASCKRDHLKHHSLKRPPCPRPVFCIQLSGPALPCPALVLDLSTKLPQTCRIPATAFHILRPPTDPYIISSLNRFLEPTIANALGHDSNSTSVFFLSFFPCMI